MQNADYNQQFDIHDTRSTAYIPFTKYRTLVLVAQHFPRQRGQLQSYYIPDSPQTSESAVYCCVLYCTATVSPLQGDALMYAITEVMFTNVQQCTVAVPRETTVAESLR